jgi:hypothetical protein
MVAPQICSEFFFCTKPVPLPNDTPCLNLVVFNDAWFSAPLRTLLLRAARLQALSWQRELLVVGYAAAYALTSRGELRGLCREKCA